MNNNSCEFLTEGILREKIINVVTFKAVKNWME